MGVKPVMVTGDNWRTARAIAKELITSADCAGALDITLDLQHLLDGDELSGLHCFRSLRDHVVAVVDSIKRWTSVQ